MLFKSCCKFHVSVFSSESDLANDFEVDYFETDNFYDALSFAKNYKDDFDFIVIYNGIKKVSYIRVSKKFKRLSSYVCK